MTFITEYDFFMQGPFRNTFYMFTFLLKKSSFAFFLTSGDSFTCCCFEDVPYWLVLLTSIRTVDHDWVHLMVSWPSLIPNSMLWELKKNSYIFEMFFLILQCCLEAFKLKVFFVSEMVKKSRRYFIFEDILSVWYKIYINNIPFSIIVVFLKKYIVACCY